MAQVITHTLIITAEEREWLIANASKFSEINIWKKGDHNRLYLNVRKQGVWIDLNDENDLRFEFPNGYFIFAYRDFIIENFVASEPVEEPEIAEAEEVEFVLSTDELGWDETPAITLTINRNPDTLTETQWVQLSQWVEETYPLTPDDISHGFSPSRGHYYFD